MTAKVMLPLDKQIHVSGLQSTNAMIKIQEARQMLHNKLRHQRSDLAAFPLPRQFMLPNLCSMFTADAQLSKSSDHMPNTESLVGSQSRRISSQHLPVHEIVISKPGADDSPFTLREESVLRQIVRNGNVELCPGVAVLIEPVSSEAVSSFLPGDELIAINDIIVGSKDEAWHQFSECKLATLKLSVRPLAELSELNMRYIHYYGDKCPRKVSCLNFSQQHNMHVEECEEHAEDNVWLVHRTGFTSAVKLPENNANSLLQSEYCLVKLNHFNIYLQAKTCDLHQMNTVQYDLAEDLASLPYLNESNVLHTLQQRYTSNLIHTYAGKNMLLVINPVHSLSVSTEQVMKMSECSQLTDMPPHVYSIAQSAYESLKKTARSQSVILLGHSGSGKTTNVSSILQHFCLTTAVQPYGQKLHDLVAAAVTLIQSFCNCHTILNSNATHCAHLFKLQYDSCSRKLVGAAVEIFLVDDMRFARRPNAESAYHIFYQFLAGVDSAVRKDLLLEKSAEPNLYTIPLHEADDEKEAVQSWHRTLHAMNVLGFSDDEVSAICATLAAICHLGVAGAVIETSNYQFARCKAAAKAASVLGVELQTLSDCIFSTPYATCAISAIDRLENFVSALYSELLMSLTFLMNRTLSVADNITSQQHSIITVLDTAGFQNPATCGRRDGATFTDLCQNYVQEGLHGLYLQTAISSMSTLCMKESNVRDVKAHVDYCGLFSLLNQLSTQGSDDNEFLASFTQQSSDTCVRKSEQANGSSLLELDHLNRTNSVQYNVQGWTKTVHMASRTPQLQALLHTSSKSNVKKLFGSLTELENHVVSYLHLKSFDRVMESLQSSNVYFIHCLLPCHTAALPTRLTSAAGNCSLNMQLLRMQLRGTKVLDALLVLKQGYSEHMLGDEFPREYQIQPHGKTYQAGSEKISGVREQLEEERVEEEKQEKVLQEVRQCDDDVVHQMRMKLKKARILAIDVKQSCSQHQQVAAEAKRQSRQAQNDVEDLQTGIAAAARARKCLELEVTDLQAELAMSNKAQHEAEERWKRLAMDNTELQSQVCEREDETGELWKKYKALVQKNAAELAMLQDQSAIIQELQSTIQEQRSDFDTTQMRLRFLHETSMPKETVAQLEAKVRELEGRISFEVASRIRAEKLSKQLKCQIDHTCVEQKWKTDLASEVDSKVIELKKQVKDLQQQLYASCSRDVEATFRSHQLEKKLHLMETECVELAENLELSERRVKDLHKSMTANTDNIALLDSSDSELDDEL